MKRTVLYARVSTERQVEKDLSIPAQIEELTQYAIDHELEVVDIYTDEGISARTADRPAFQLMISDAKKQPRPFDVILFHKNDRFARNREDAIVYKNLLRKECGIELIAIKEDFGEGPYAQLIEGILEIMAEFYSINLSQEARKGMKKKAQSGKVLGLSPIGYQPNEDGFLSIVEDEAKIVQYIFREYTETKKGLRAIAMDLKKYGYSIFGKVAEKYKWSAAGLKVILTNPTYVGDKVWNQRDTTSGKITLRDKSQWITVIDAHPAIIDRDTFHEAQEILKMKRNYRSSTSDYLLKGMTRCMDCGGNLTQFKYKWTNSSGKQVTQGLRCSNYVHTGECYFNNILMRDIESELFSYLRDIINSRIPKDKLYISTKQSQSLNLRLSQYQKELKQIDERFERQMIAFENEIITVEQLKIYRDRLTNEKEQLVTDIHKLQEKINQRHIDTKLLSKKIASVIDIIEDQALELEERRSCLKTIVDHIEYSKNQNKLAVYLITA